MRPTVLPEGLVVREHTVYESGLHGDTRLALGLLLTDAERLDQWAAMLADRLRSSHPEVIVGPALGGAVVGQRVAASLGIMFAPSELVSSPGEVARYELTIEIHNLIAGRRIVIVDDAINAGAAVIATGRRVIEIGGEVVAVGSVIGRVPLAALPIGGRTFQPVVLHELGWETWTAGDCPVCRGPTPGETPP